MSCRRPRSGKRAEDGCRGPPATADPGRAHRRACAQAGVPGGVRTLRDGLVNRPVRAVVDSGLAILAALTLLIVATVVLFATAPETVLSNGFRWVGGAVVIVVLSSSGVAAGALAARRLPEGRRMPLALAGPLLVM